MEHFQIEGTNLPVVEYHGQRVVTFAMVDQAHQRRIGTAQRNFTANREMLSEGEDFFLADSSQNNVLRCFGIEVPNRGLTLLAESGYLMIVKTMTDSLSWKVQRSLVNGYFRLRDSERHLTQTEKYWFARRPAWPEIRQRVLAGQRYRDVAAALARSVDSVVRSVRRMIEVGLLDPVRLVAAQHGPARLAARRLAVGWGLMQEPEQLALALG